MILASSFEAFYRLRRILFGYVEAVLESTWQRGLITPVLRRGGARRDDLKQACVVSGRAPEREHMLSHAQTSIYIRACNVST